MKKILIMGLPGSGKTTLAKEVKHRLESQGSIVDWFNADDIRTSFNDWDFSYPGRIRQATRMKDLADRSSADFVLVDFVAPLVEMRDTFDPHWIIWLDTVEKSPFEDTDKIFTAPSKYDFRIAEKNAEKWANIISEYILANNIT